MKKQDPEVTAFRAALREEVGRCEICGAAPGRHVRNTPAELAALNCHEIANGIHRQKALDKPFAILVLCAWCNQYAVTNKAEWPQSRQLAVLQKKRPLHYDLAAFNHLVNPNAPDRITQEEVDDWGNRES